MNPLELTQAAAESSGRTLADISPVYGELVDIAQSNVDEKSKPGTIPDSIIHLEQRLEQAEQCRNQARELLQKALEITENIPNVTHGADVLIDIATLTHDPDTIRKAFEASDYVHNADRYQRLVRIAELDPDVISIEDLLVGLDQYMISFQLEIYDQIGRIYHKPAYQDYARELASKLTESDAAAAFAWTQLARTDPDPALIGKALSYAAKIPNSFQKAEALTRIAAIDKNQSAITLALEEAEAMNVHGSYHKAKTIATIAAITQNEALAQKAKDVDTHSLHPESQSEILVMIARVTHDEGTISQALRLARSAIGPAIYPALRGVIEVIAQAGDTKRAKELADILPHLEDKAHAYIGIAQALINQAEQIDGIEFYMAGPRSSQQRLAA